MTISRRTLLGGVLGMFGAAGVSAATVAELASAEPQIESDDLGLLAWVLDKYPGETVAAEMLAQIADGTFSVRNLKRRLGSAEQRDRRQVEARNQRAKHVGDEVLYRGPLRIRQLFTGSESRTAHRQRISEATTRVDYTIRGIGVATMDRGPAVVDRNDDGLTKLIVEPAQTRDIVIPAPVRVVIDMRREVGEVCAAELVRTRRPEHQRRPLTLYLWAGNSSREIDDNVPELIGGVVIDTAPEFGTRLEL